ITATAGGGLNALEGDLRALTAALVAAGGGRSPVLVLNPVQNTSLSLIAGPHFRIPVWPSNAVPVGTVIMVEPTSFASAFFARSRIRNLQPSHVAVSGYPHERSHGWNSNEKPVANRFGCLEDTDSRRVGHARAPRRLRDRSDVVAMLTDEFRRYLRDLYDEQDRMLFEHAQWEASREAERDGPIERPYVEKSGPAGGLVFKTVDDAMVPAPQPETVPFEGEPALDDYSRGIAEFVVTWCNEKLVPRDARIAKLETQVEVLLTLLGK